MNIDIKNIPPQIIALQLLSQADAALCEAWKHYQEVYVQAQMVGMKPQALNAMGAPERRRGLDHEAFAPFGDELILDDDIIARFNAEVNRQAQAKEKAPANEGENQPEK